MKKCGFIMIEYIIALIVFMTLISGVIKISSNLTSSLEYNSHSKFKNEFLNFINYSKYESISQEFDHTLKFYSDRISLTNKYGRVVKQFKFPANVEMKSFNGISNRYLVVYENGLIPRGATFIYSFNDDINVIKIAAITGKVNYG